MMKPIAFLFCSLALTASLAAQSDSSVTDTTGTVDTTPLDSSPVDAAAADEAAITISDADMLSRISLLADDSMRGRDTPSRELEKTAEWIASEFERMGLQPAGDNGGFIQRYGVVRSQWDVVESSGSMSGPSDIELVMGRDFLVVPHTRLNQRTGSFSGDLLLVQAPRDQRPFIPDSIDLEGKIIVTYHGRLPSGDNPIIPYDKRWSERGAAGVIWVMRVPEERFGLLIQAWNRSETTHERAGEHAPFVFVKDAALKDPLEEWGFDLRDLEDEANDLGEVIIRSLSGLSATFDIRRRIFKRDTPPNVVGILPGSDPDLKFEYVLYSAHMDHVGMVGRGIQCPRGDDDKDRICNGADDNASGTAAIMEIAEAFSSLPTAPRRSLVFLLVSGEEKGLWGSRAYVEEPAVPLRQTVADLNVDMIGRNWQDTIVVLGRPHSTLGSTLDSVAARHPELGLQVVDDLWPDQKFFLRSDHYNFAVRGIPILFFMNGDHEDYHKPSDEVDKIDIDKAARVARLMFYVGLEVANAGPRPEWDPEWYDRVVLDPVETSSSN